jgi:ADP-ribosylglycohydrolase
MIAESIEGQSIIAATFNTIEKLSKEKGSLECISKLEEAISLSQSDLSDNDAISMIGEGWIGEEALGISVFCAMRYQNDFRQALIAAVNHSGDSDSTGSITGNILGAYSGIDCIPKEWFQNTELTEEIVQLANDLHRVYEDSSEWWRKYPGY